MLKYLKGFFKVRIPHYKWLRVKGGSERSYVRPIYYGDDYIVMESLNGGWYFTNYLTLHTQYEVI